MSGLVQGSAAWFAARLNKLTASNLGAVMAQIPGHGYSRKEALKRARGLSEFKGNEATEWGSKMESEGNCTQRREDLLLDAVQCSDGDHRQAVA